ncbi:MAG: family 43 glycosylhydrolase, partial [Microlunatus sp.]|nr:family 43 glycosylhydrolase [Microlunatus sp.]
GTIYYYALSTDQGGAESALSAPRAVTTALNAPLTPIDLQVSRATSTGVELTWSPADSRAAGYRLYRSETDSTKAKLIYDGSDPNARDGSAEKGLTYRYSVSAYNRTGESPRSNPVTVTVPKAADHSIVNGLLWYDTNNKVIQAHGGSIIKVGKTYYWFGEDKAHNGASFRNVAIYASTDLTHWTFRNNALTPQSSPELADAKIERPKIIYNDRTKQYVLWGHKELAGDYNQARVAVATSPTVDGDYTYRGSFRPDPDGDGVGDESRDYTIFKDDDGTAYLISSTNANLDLAVYRLTPDYLNVSERIATLFPGQRREAPAVMKRNGTYYLFTSGQSGWAPNQGMFATAKSMAGPWSALKPFGDSWTYATQPAFIYPIQGTNATNYLYVGDRWRPTRLGASEYIWLPLRFGTDGTPVLDYTDRLSVDPKSAAVTTPQRSRIDGDAVASASSNSAGHEPAAGHDSDDATYWEAASRTLPAWYELDLGSARQVGRIDLNWRGIKGSEAFYHYTISASADGSQWTTIADRSTNIDLGFTSDVPASAKPYRYLRVEISDYRNFNNNNVPGYNPGLNEMRVYGVP